jgi:hypothetical protein
LRVKCELEEVKVYEREVNVKEKDRNNLYEVVSVMVRIVNGKKNLG